MFNSPEQAVRFAFKVRHKSIISKAHNVFVAKEKHQVKSREAMSAYDFHAQGAMIFGFIERLGEDELAWTYWMYGDANERKVSARMLSDTYPHLGSLGIDRSSVYQAMLSTSVRNCASQLGITNYRAWKLRRRILDSMVPLERRVLDGLWQWMGEE
jgi:hypothetical protein